MYECLSSHQWFVALGFPRDRWCAHSRNTEYLSRTWGIDEHRGINWQALHPTDFLAKSLTTPGTKNKNWEFLTSVMDPSLLPTCKKLKKKVTTCTIFLPKLNGMTTQSTFWQATCYRISTEVCSFQRGSWAKKHSIKKSRRNTRRI